MVNLRPSIPHGVAKSIITQMEDGQARIVRGSYLKSLRSVASQMRVFLSVRPFRGDSYQVKRVLVLKEAA